MYHTIVEDIICAATTIILEQLDQEKFWESVLAYLQTKQGQEGARKRNSTSDELLYQNLAFY